jgi:hypothetical protein
MGVGLIIQFTTMDDSEFRVDFEAKTWARGGQHPDIPGWTEIEEGELVPMSLGAYALKGRTPKTTGPGAGLATIGILPLPVKTTMFICLRANVPVKDFTMPDPITEIKYEVVNA